MSDWCSKCGGVNHEGHDLIDHCSICGGVKYETSMGHIDPNKTYRHCFCHMRKAVVKPVADEQETRLGIIYISHIALQSISPAITIDMCSIQRELRDQGVFDRIHRHLLLPDTYTIKAMFYARQGDCQQWELWVESPDLPVSTTGIINDLPEIRPTYCVVEGESHLVKIQIIPRPQTVPITGGIDWLLKAMVEPAAKKYGMTMRSHGDNP